MLTRLAAQGLVDGLSALTLAGAALGVARRATPLRPYLVFVFGSLATFFTARAAFEATGWPGPQLVQRLVACVLPVAALLLAEGVLRRHAPRALKLFVSGAALVALATAVFASRQAWPDTMLAVYVVVALAGTTALLLARDRTSLSRQENAGVSALVAAGLLVTAASATDFIASAPVGLSGVGAASVAFVLAANPASAREARRVIIEFLALALVAAVVAFALARGLALAGPAEMTRLAAVLLAVLLAAAAVVSAVRVRSGHRETEFALALARADTTRLDRFLDGVADQPLLSGLRLAEGTQLSDYDTEGLAAAVAARTVWTPAALGTAAIAVRAREELADLLARHDATHAVVVSEAPLRIALLTLPDGGAPDAVEAQLALFGKLAATAARGSR
jgi:hypothetical protein